VTIVSKARRAFCSGLLLCTAGGFAACQRNVCDMTPDGSVWLTVARLSWAEAKFHGLHGRYGELVEMTNLFDGLPPDVTAGRIGSYVITIKLTSNGYILRANPEFRQSDRSLAAFYGDQTGIVTYNRSGEPAGPYDRRM
jgi:hypothetical protein